MECAICEDRDCLKGKDCTGLHDEIIAEYTPEDLRLHVAASRVVSKYYGEKTRLEEIALFARELGVSRIGIALCSAVSEEARVVHQYLKKEGFDVRSAMCKICGVDKEELGAVRTKPPGEFEPSCNPVGQAKILADEDTEYNISMGLCVGHDAIFNAKSRVPVTTLVTKDRVLAHNPLGVVYTKYGRVHRLGLKE